MKAAIHQRARELGFDDCRFTSAAAPEHAAHLERWLATGQHGEMGWLARNASKRVDPQQVLAGVRTVICLAVSYATTEEVISKQYSVSNERLDPSALNTGLPLP